MKCRYYTIANLLIIIGLIFLGYQYYCEKKRASLLEKDIQELKYKLNSTLSRNRKLSGELANYKVKVIYLEEQINYLRNKLNNIQATNELFHNVSSWMYANFYYNFSQESFTKEIIESCVYDKTINLPCVLYILREYYGFHYENDTLDLIKPVPQFIKDKGGDCEDWALFVASLTNYLIRQYKTYKLSLYVPKNGSKFVLLVKDKKEIYYANCEEKILNISNYYPSILCYLNENLGHCVVGFSKEFLTPINLKNETVYLIETQTGQYLGTLNDYEYSRSVFIIANPEGLYIKHWGWWI